MIRLSSPNPANEDEHEYAWLSDGASPGPESSTRKTWRGRTSAKVMAAVALLFLLVAGLVSSDVVPVQMDEDQSLLQYATSLISSPANTLAYPPSASALPPALSTLPAAFKRITLVAIWNNDARPFYLHNFFRSAELNADVADLLVVNILEEKEKCLQPEEFGVKDYLDGGNVRILCVNREEFLHIERDALCAAGTGWGCNAEQSLAVMERLREREDYINNDWKAMRGEMFRKYFIHPDNPLWAWSDMDMHLGRLDHLPFPLLSTMSFVTLQYFTATLLFLPGQLTLFNMASPGLVGAWRNYHPLASPEQFCKPIGPEEGGFAEGAIDESYLSAAYLRNTEGYAGKGLSWAAVPDVHGQDIFIPGRKFVVSGRNVLEVDADLTREEIEAIVKIATKQAVDEYAGWTDEADVVPVPMLYGDDCQTFWFDASVAQCVAPNNLTRGDQYTRIDSARRGTVLRIGADEPGQLQMRTEPDRRPRRWQRKLFLHYQEIKRQEWWWSLPEYFIGDQGEVMEFDWKVQYIWKMGEKRDANIWERHNDRLADDGTSAHTHTNERRAVQTGEYAVRRWR